MNNDSVHPARSPDFLSRLHDGELTAGERAHFESHRAHCSECRRAASEFEAALSLFRASSTSPPSTDLARRILRKLEATAPQRRRFGIVHGIHPKWAAGFAVAVIAAVLGSAIVLEREAARKAILRQSPIPVLLQKERNQAGDASKAPREGGGSLWPGGQRGGRVAPKGALRA
jgi:anti-sigma factor RsiW